MDRLIRYYYNFLHFPTQQYLFAILGTINHLTYDKSNQILKLQLRSRIGKIIHLLIPQKYYRNHFIFLVNQALKKKTNLIIYPLQIVIFQNQFAYIFSSQAIICQIGPQENLLKSLESQLTSPLLINFYQYGKHNLINKLYTDGVNPSQIIQTINHLIIKRVLIGVLQLKKGEIQKLDQKGRIKVKGNLYLDELRRVNVTIKIGRSNQQHMLIQNLKIILKNKSLVYIPECCLTLTQKIDINYTIQGPIYQLSNKLIKKQLKLNIEPLLFYPGIHRQLIKTIATLTQIIYFTYKYQCVNCFKNMISQDNCINECNMRGQLKIFSFCNVQINDKIYFMCVKGKVSRKWWDILIQTYQQEMINDCLKYGQLKITFIPTPKIFQLNNNKSIQLQRQYINFLSINLISKVVVIKCQCSLNNVRFMQFYMQQQKLSDFIKSIYNIEQYCSKNSKVNINGSFQLYDNKKLAIINILLIQTYPLYLFYKQILQK